ncbi:MAG: hypothetical protein RL220_297 [Bacteroidota bacterium]
MSNDPSSSAGDNVRQDVFTDFSPEIKLRTKKMMMWLIIFSIVMLFAGITSALIVLYGKLYWVHVTPPSALWVSIAFIILSSITAIMALRFTKAGEMRRAAWMMVATFVLGLGFTVSQIQGWNALSDKGMGRRVFTTADGQQYSRWNPLRELNGEYGVDYTIERNGVTLEKKGDDYFMPGDYSKPLTADVEKNFNASGALIAVLVYVHIFHLALGLIYLLVNTFRIHRGVINRDNWVSLYTGGMYWHFMGILWVYLFFFLFFIY